MRAAAASRTRPYLLALSAVAGATLSRFIMDPWVHSKAPYLLFVSAVAVAALFGGLRAGVAATLLSLPVCDYFFIDPRYTFFIYDARGDFIALGVFAVVGLAVSTIIERFRRTRVRLRESLLALEESERRFRTLAATTPEMLFTAAPDGAIRYVSRRFCDYTGLNPEEGYAHWVDVLHPEDRPRVMEQWNQSVASGAEFEASYRIRGADGQYGWFKTHAKPVRAPDGGITQWTGVSADIHALKMLEQALTRRTEELAASNAEFQKFAYRVSHDLREPLRTIRVFTEMVVRRNEKKFDQESREWAGYIVGSIARIQRQMTQLLEYAKAGSLEVKRELVHLEAILETAVADLRSAIDETGATVTHDPLPWLVINPEQMRSVFQNLIGNALKYRGDCAPRVHVTSRVEGGAWIFAVQDNGIGFETSEADRIFRPFERLSPGAAVPGSGLGLAIVKRIVELKGGLVWAESQPGRGSTFFFTLPRTLEDRASHREGHREGAPPKGSSAVAS